MSYHGDKWVIRTFLFLTNEGTPEGTKLKEIIGLEKEDAKYLMIDRVTAFLDYDIEHDQRLVIGDDTIADAVLDRIVHTSHRIELKGESLRKKR